MDDEKLIELVRKYPEMYNLAHKLYMNVRHKEKIWILIGKELNQDADQCKKRWCNIRDNFRKNLQKRKAKRGWAAKRCIKYRFEDQLQFLLENFAGREYKNISNKKNVATDDETWKEEEKNEPDLDVSIDNGEYQSIDEVADGKEVVGEPPTASRNSSASPKFFRPCKRITKRNTGANKRKETLDTASSVLIKYLLDNKLKQNIEPSTIHPIDTFLASLSPTLKGLNPYYQNIAKTKIFEAVQSLELEQIMQTEQCTSPDPTMQSPPSPSPRFHSHSPSPAPSNDNSNN